MPWVNLNQPTPLERIVGGICYLTFGLAGILYVVLGGRQSSFFRFHFLQSIVLSILGVLLSWSRSVLIVVLSTIFSMLAPQTGSVISGTVSWTISVIFQAGGLLLIYGMICSFLGKYAEIPFVSNIVHQQMR